MSGSTVYSAKKWLPLILVIKIIVFAFYAVHFHLYPYLPHGFLYVEGGDTFTFYPPMINLLSGSDYGHACRMPGLLPFFAPFYLVSGNLDLSYNGVVILQFIVSSLSVYFLGLISVLLFNNRKIFILTIVLYSLFYHIGDHFLMSDSFANSILIIAVYFFLFALKNDFQDKRIVLLSGGLFTWVIFLRVIGIVPFLVLAMCMLVYLIRHKVNLSRSIGVLASFCIILVIAESLWIVRNQKVYGRFIPFTVSDCYPAFSGVWLTYAKIPSSWGYESTPWGGQTDWLLDEKSTLATFPYPAWVTTTHYNSDSIQSFKGEYFSIIKLGEGDEKVSASRVYDQRVNAYLNEFKKEKAFRFYILNPAKLLFKFHFQSRIVDIPFPPLQEMNVFQKIFKAFSWLAMVFMNAFFFFLAPVYFLLKKRFDFFCFLAVPFSISCFLTFYMQAIEQRYFWPIIPFAVLFTSYVFEKGWTLFKSKNSYRPALEKE